MVERFVKEAKEGFLSRLRERSQPALFIPRGEAHAHFLRSLMNGEVVKRTGEVIPKESV